MQLTAEQIREILKLVDASRLEEFRLETADVKLVVRKAGAPAGEAALAAGVDPLPPVDAGTTDGVSAPGAPPARPAARPVEEVPTGLVAVRAPMVGTFYRAPAPGAPPFVEAGSHVEESDTVCILEVMKLMSSIPAGVRGRVVRLCVENATVVAQDQALVLIEPEGGGRG
jgi:acetyl-CoA carboxylase biotin carboxyl carrier protein